MSSFKIKIEGLDILKKSLSQDKSLAKLIPDISIEVLKLHNVLERRVEDLFNTPGNLSSVRIGNSLAPVKVGTSLLRYSLQYRDKSIPLSKYPFSITDSSAISSAPLRKADGFVKWTKGKWSKDIKVSIRKGKPVFAKRDNNYRQKGFFTGTNIKARSQTATWNTFPTKGVAGTRAPYVTLFGPSLSQIASKVYDKDSSVKQAVEIMYDNIAESFARSYG